MQIEGKQQSVERVGFESSRAGFRSVESTAVQPSVHMSRSRGFTVAGGLPSGFPVARGFTAGPSHAHGFTVATASQSRAALQAHACSELQDGVVGTRADGTEANGTEARSEVYSDTVSGR